MDIQDVRHIRKISTSQADDFEERVNNLLKSGDYVLLQIGFEIAHDDRGKLITPTIAVLGSERPKPLKPQIVYVRP